MQTVLYKEVDGYKIITGFDTPTVDPVETAKIVNEVLKETSEHQALEAKKAEYVQANKNLYDAAKAKDKEKYTRALDAMDALQEELKPIAREHADKIISLRREHAVHFTPRMGEVIKTIEEVKTLATAIKDKDQGIFITLEGETIQDNRGKVYYRKVSGKWGRTNIIRLGDVVPGNAVLHDNLTETQSGEVERDLIAALPADVKAKEKERALATAIKTAADMRSRLEIQGDSDALVKSQDWYQAEVTRIEALYV